MIWFNSFPLTQKHNYQSSRIQDDSKRHSSDPNVDAMLDSLDLSKSKAQSTEANTTTANRRRRLKQKSLLSNQSKFKTSKIVGLLKKDPETFQKLLEKLREEHEIYNFARELHYNQTRTMREKLSRES